LEDEVEAGARLRLGGERSRAARCRAGKTDQDWSGAAGRICRSTILKNVLASELRASPFVGTGACGPRERSEAGGETLAISRSSLYYRRQPRASRADRFSN